MTITAETCRSQGVDERTIASMERNGFFQPISERSDVESDIDALESDLESWLEEIAELQLEVVAARTRLAALKSKLATLPPDEDD